MRSKKGGALPNFHGKVYTINQFMVLAENPVSQSRRRLSRKETPVNPARIQAVDAKHVKEGRESIGQAAGNPFQANSGFTVPRSPSLIQIPCVKRCSGLLHL
jgi:hypothetical protein